MHFDKVREVWGTFNYHIVTGECDSSSLTLVTLGFPSHLSDCGCGARFTVVP